MDSRRDRKRMNVECVDRLSSLPDDLIQKILSYISTKHAIQTCVLSSRWRYIWTSMPCLNFSSKDFNTLPTFSKFVKRVLSGRNNHIEVSSIEIAFRGKVSQAFVRRILRYAFSHNVQRLNITCLHEKKMEFPLSRFSSQSLKHLTLKGYTDKHSIMTPPTWELQALTTLNICAVTLYDGIFSNCANLKDLTLRACRMMDRLNGFNICHPGLTSLTLEDGCERVNVVAPQLKNLTIRYWGGMLKISAPNLSSLHYKTYYYCYRNERVLQLSTELFCLEKAHVCIHRLYDTMAYNHKIVGLLQQLYRAKYLTLNLELVKLLSSSMELISDQPSPFLYLKSLKIYPADVTETKVTMPSEVRNYLLDSSPSATFTMVSYEEIIAVKNVTTARNLLIKLQVVLDDRLKEKSETNITNMKKDNAPSESHIATVDEQVEVENHSAQPDTKTKWHFGERMTRIESYWEDLNEQLEKGYKTTSRLISLVRKIEGVLTKLPTSHKDKLQARFYGLCAEAETVMDNMMDRMKMQCDKKPSGTNVSFHELATTSQPSS